jgi:hypothetical protein
LGLCRWLLTIGPPDSEVFFTAFSGDFLRLKLPLVLHPPSGNWGHIVQHYCAVIGTREKVLLLFVHLGAIGHLGREELDAVDQPRVFLQSVKDLACCEFPDNYLSIFARTCNKSIALANVNLCDVVVVPVQRGLQRERVAVPHFNGAENVSQMETYPSSPAEIMKSPF